MPAFMWREVWSLSARRNLMRESGHGMFCGGCNILGWYFGVTGLTKVNTRQGTDCRGMNW